MGKDRVDLGFSDALDDFNPAEWAPKSTTCSATDRAARSIDLKLAEAAGFKSRETQQQKSQHRSVARRRRTGRNAQFNLKARPDTIEAFCAIADKQGWGLGETLEHAVVLLKIKYGTKDHT